MWRQRLAPYCVAGTSAWCLCKPRHCATPSGALTSFGVWMFALLEHAPLHVVPGTQPLTSSLLYKHYLFSSPPGALPSFLSVFSARTGYEPGALKKSKELLISLDAIPVGQDRDSHIRVLYLILKNSIFDLTSFWLQDFASGEPDVFKML